jgi:uncharacterized protein involved in tolerance to divalent cations
VSFDVGQALASPVANEMLALHSYQLPVILLRPFVPATMDAMAWLAEPSSRASRQHVAVRPE